MGEAPVGKSACCRDPDRRTGKERREGLMAEAAGKSMRGGARKTDLRHQPSFYLATMIAWTR